MWQKIIDSGPARIGPIDQNNGGKKIINVAKRYQFQQGVFTHTDYKNKMKRKKQASLYTVHETHFSIQEESTKLPIFVADPDSIARIWMRSDSNSILALSAHFHVAAT